EDLDTVIAAVADIDPAVIGDLHAVYRIAKEHRLCAPRRKSVGPAPRRLGRGVVNRVVSIGAEVADIFSGGGVGDHDAAVAVAVGHIEPVGRRVHDDVGRLVEDRRAVDAAVLVVAVECVGRAADAHLEIPVHVELQDEAVGAQLVGGPGRARPGAGRLGAAFLRRLAAIGGVTADPDIVVGIDIDAVLVARPDAAVGGAAMIFHPAGIGGPAPGA